jgi:hypothetical protein
VQRCDHGHGPIDDAAGLGRVLNGADALGVLGRTQSSRPGDITTTSRPTVPYGRRAAMHNAQDAHSSRRNDGIFGERVSYGCVSYGRNRSMGASSASRVPRNRSAVASPRSRDEQPSKRHGPISKLDQRHGTRTGKGHATGGAVIATIARGALAAKLRRCTPAPSKPRGPTLGYPDPDTNAVVPRGL